jgi:hypothetical protein
VHRKRSKRVEVVVPVTPKIGRERLVQIGKQLDFDNRGKVVQLAVVALGESTHRLMVVVLVLSFELRIREHKIRLDFVHSRTDSLVLVPHSLIPLER